jgi:hypothetical protein
MMHFTEIDTYTTNNDPPTEDVRAAVIRRLKSLRSHNLKQAEEVRRLDTTVEAKWAMIQALEREIQGLHAMKRRAQLNMVANRNIFRQTKLVLSPIRRIPAEVIASIIAFAIEGNDDHVGRRERMMFLPLRCVSRIWRQTAFSTPTRFCPISLLRMLSIMDASKCPRERSQHSPTLYFRVVSSRTHRRRAILLHPGTPSLYRLPHRRNGRGIQYLDRHAQDP